LSEDNLLLTGNLGQLPCNDVETKSVDRLLPNTCLFY
jgi:hypothetical protein